MNLLLNRSWNIWDFKCCVITYILHVPVVQWIGHEFAELKMLVRFQPGAQL